MKKNLKIIFVLVSLLISCSEEPIREEVVDDDNLDEIENLYKYLLKSPDKSITTKVFKRNPKKLYVHYMPWFHSIEIDGYWGQHWTMTNRNPDNINIDGRREIASHYYPLIGPYSSRDNDLQEYHLLLMKLSGVDGVIFDWYGSRDLHDYLSLKENTESFIKEIEEVGLQFAIMYEDKVAEHTAPKGGSYKERLVNGISVVVSDLKYIKETYFKSTNYISLNGEEMLFVFGPHYLTNANDWETVFSNSGIRPKIYTLWKASDRIGEQAGGEFSWVDKDHLQTLLGYYNYVRENNITTIGGVYGGFDDYYYEGGWRDNFDNDWEIPHNGMTVFNETLNLMDNEPVEFIQLLTWNDFGEGTMIEPTIEFGFEYLRKLQIYTGVNYLEDDLKLPYKLYLLRKKYPESRRLNKVLDGVYEFIFSLELNKAKELLEKIDKSYPV